MRHPARHDLLAALPDQRNDTGGDQQLVDGLEPGAQPDDAQVGLRLLVGQRIYLRHAGIRPAEQAQHAHPGELLLDPSGERGVRLARNAGTGGHLPTGNIAEQQRQRHRQQGQSGQPGIEQEHRDDQRNRKQDRVPGLDDELAHADPQHLDIADHPRHQIADGCPMQLGWGRGEDAAHRIGADVGADTRVARSSATSA